MFSSPRSATKNTQIQQLLAVAALSMASLHPVSPAVFAPQYSKKRKAPRQRLMQGIGRTPEASWAMEKEHADWNDAVDARKQAKRTAKVDKLMAERIAEFEANRKPSV